MSDLLNTFNESAGLTEMAARRARRTSSRNATGSDRIQLLNMLDPQRNTADLKPRDNKPAKLAMPEPLSFKLSPSLGRTVRIDSRKGMDVGRAFRQLDIAVARNRVRADFTKQKFHERPGLRRKRLKSERWRRKFKEGFRGMVKMVNAMRKKGW